jgi:hypothetical protein
VVNSERRSMKGNEGVNVIAHPVYVRYVDVDV